MRTGRVAQLTKDVHYPPRPGEEALNGLTVVSSSSSPQSPANAAP